MALAPGTPAPDFALPLIAGEAPLRLADYRGEKTVVLVFFPLAFSSLCTAEIGRIAEEYESWTRSGAEVVGISVDSPFVTQRFTRETGASFPIVSDFNRDVVTAYDVRNDDYFGMRGVANRSVFVVDRAGVIRYAWTAGDQDRLPPFDEVRGAVMDAGEA